MSPETWTRSAPDARQQYLVAAPELVVRDHRCSSLHRRGTLVLLDASDAEALLKRGDIIRLDEVA